MIDEDDGRKALDGDPVFGPLPGEAPELPEPEPAALPTGMKAKPSKPTKAKIILTRRRQHDILSPRLFVFTKGERNAVENEKR